MCVQERERERERKREYLETYLIEWLRMPEIIQLISIGTVIDGNSSCSSETYN